MKECRMYWMLYGEKRAKKPGKEWTVYSDEDRVAIGKYTSESRNASASNDFIPYDASVP